MNARTLTFDLEVRLDQQYHLVDCRVTEGMSEITRASVGLAMREELDVSRLLESKAIFRICVDGDEVRRWTLTVGGVSFLGAEEDSLRYRVDLYESLWFLQFTQDTRKFRNMRTEAIVSRVLGATVPHAFRTTRSCDERNYCVQYHETNLAFVRRLLEFEGIYHTLDPDGILILADRSAASTELGGVFELIDASGALEREQFGIHELHLGARVTTGKATVNDWDWKKPRANLLASASADGDVDLEVYDYPSGYRHEGQGKQLASRRLESLRVGATYVRGAGNSPNFAPAHIFTFADHAGASFSGEYLLTHVEHWMRAPGYGGAAHVTYQNRFHAIPRSVPFRPTLETPRPTIAGNHTATVRGPLGEEIHTDKYGRFRAQFHWDREAKRTDEDSRWIRMLQESATSMTLARVGWEVNIAYIDGDPDRPIGVSRHINGLMVPAYGLPDNQTRMTIQTPTYPGGVGYNEWRMEDAAGSMHMDVRAERDFNVRVENDKSEKVGRNETHWVVENFQHDVERHQRVIIGRHSHLTVNGEDRTVVLKNRDVRVGGSDRIEVKKELTISVGRNDNESVGGLNLTIAGGIKVPTLSPRDFLANFVRSTASKAIQGNGPGGSPMVQAVPMIGGGSDAPGPALNGVMGGLLGTLMGRQSHGMAGPNPPGVGTQAVQRAAGNPINTGMQAVQNFLPNPAGAMGNPINTGMQAVQNFLPNPAGAMGNPISAGMQAVQNFLPNPAGAIGNPISAGMQASGGITHGLSQPLSLDKLIDTFCSGAISRSTSKHIGRMVGGAYIAVAVGNLSTRVGFGYLETVGGLKFTLAGGGIGENVGGPLTMTVGGAIIRKAKGNMSVTAKKSKLKVGIAAKLSSDERIELHGEEITIEAAAKLSLKQNDLAIELSPGQMSIKGKMKLDAGDRVVVYGNKDILT